MLACLLVCLSLLFVVFPPPFLASFLLVSAAARASSFGFPNLITAVARMTFELKKKWKMTDKLTICLRRFSIRVYGRLQLQSRVWFLALGNVQRDSSGFLGTLWDSLRFLKMSKSSVLQAMPGTLVLRLFRYIEIPRNDLIGLVPKTRFLDFWTVARSWGFFFVSLELSSIVAS